MNHQNDTVRSADRECPICFEDDVADAIAITGCGHTFHEHCIDEYIAFNNSRRFVECPVCRAVIFENLEVVSNADEEERQRQHLQQRPLFNDIETKMIALSLLGFLLLTAMIILVLW
jgi:hypothetical protein